MLLTLRFRLFTRMSFFLLCFTGKASHSASPDSRVEMSYKFTLHGIDVSRGERIMAIFKVILPR